MCLLPRRKRMSSFNRQENAEMCYRKKESPDDECKICAMKMCSIVCLVLVVQYADL